jgi:hypothetical protein
MRFRRARNVESMELDVPEMQSDSDAASGQVAALATAFGYVLGAASMCPTIDEARIAVTADRLAEILKLCADDERETCAGAFEEAILEGKESVAAGEIDESTVERALHRTEQMLGR